MWILDEPRESGGRTVLRWMLLFASPKLFHSFEADKFSCLYLIAALTALMANHNLATMLTRFAKDEKTNWVLFGRVASFAGDIVLNIEAGLQIWTGFIMASLVTSMFANHNSLLIFSLFTLAGIFIMGVFNAALPPLKDLR